ncbi:MAG: hypothetical protein ACO1SX_03080 [Actinomycetota bacterium]
MSSLLNDAITRHSQSQRSPVSTGTLEEALEIARQLDIPAEHVMAAAQEVQLRRLREVRRGIARQRRKAPFVAALAIAMGIAVVVILVKLAIGGILSALLAFLPALYLGWRWLAAPVTDAEADAVELPPVPGTCRVCGASATTPRSTFCTEHEYRGPGQ